MRPWPMSSRQPLQQAWQFFNQCGIGVSACPFFGIHRTRSHAGPYAESRIIDDGPLNLPPLDIESPPRPCFTLDNTNHFVESCEGGDGPGDLNRIAPFNVLL